MKSNLLDRKRIKLPKWIEPFVLQNARYKCVYGGRGAGAKSTSIATALLLSAAAATETILCCREYLKSIDKSVYTLLKKIILFWEKEKIVKQGFFTITRNEITCARTDSIFF